MLNITHTHTFVTYDCSYLALYCGFDSRIVSSVVLEVKLSRPGLKFKTNIPQLYSCPDAKSMSLIHVIDISLDTGFFYCISNDFCISRIKAKLQIIANAANL